MKAPPKVYWLSDNFEDAAFNFGMWHLASHGQGLDAAERNGRLEFSIAPDVATESGFGIDQHYGTNCRLIGDFDARVEFKLLAWPPADGMYVEFGAYFPLNAGFEYISRQGRWSTGGWDAYSSSLGWARIAETTDTAGVLRLTREGGVLTGYYRAGKRWIRLGSERAPQPTQLILELWSNADQFGHVPASAAFDNFTAIADDVECPGVPVPPQKPRV